MSNLTRKDVKSMLREIEALNNQVLEINKKAVELKKGLSNKNEAVQTLDLGDKGRAAVGVDGAVHVSVVLDTDEEIKTLITFLEASLEEGGE
jgi:hypothetical protein